MSAIPTIAPPHPDPRAPDFVLPPRTCDSHCHIFGPDNRYPYAAERPYTPPDAPLDMLQALHARLRIERAVIVNATPHGRDNRVVTDAIAHVVRCFANDNVVHVSGNVDPIRDIEVIDTELALADLATVEKALNRYRKPASAEEVEAAFAKRKVGWTAPDFSDRKGVYRQYTQHAASLMAGAYIR